MCGLQNHFKFGETLQGEVISSDGRFVHGDSIFFIATIKTNTSNEFQVAFGDGFPPQIGDKVKGTIGGQIQDSDTHRNSGNKQTYVSLNNISPLTPPDMSDPFAAAPPYKPYAHLRWNGR